MVTELLGKVGKYLCNNCQTSSGTKSDYEKHLLTAKHRKRVSGDKEVTDLSVKLKCTICSRLYKSRNGLWKHSKSCKPVTSNVNINFIINDNNSHDNNTINDNEDFKKLILEVIKSNSDLQKTNTELQKQNSDLQKQMVEVCKNSNNTVINSNNNKTFNLNFFLNEQCKDAMNISEFVNTFDLQLEDLESVGELGYVEGMTKIIVDKLNSMDIYKRPMHCSDAKREIIYIKDENIWAREERTNPKLRQAIKTVTFRNMKQVKKWSDKHPESLNNESHLNDKYMMLVIQSTGGNGLIGDSENKIIRHIVKEIIIGKNLL